jgi:hypothetical protein
MVKIELVVKPGKLVPNTVTWLPAEPLVGLSVMVGLGTQCLLMALAAKPNAVAVTVLVDGMVASVGTWNVVWKVPVEVVILVATVSSPY